MMQLIVLSFADGSVGIMHLHLEPRLPDGVIPPGFDPFTGRREATDEAITYEVERSGLTPVRWRRIEPEDLPKTRDYRNAWTDTGREIAHDMPKARELHRAILRRARGPLLAALDVEYQRADEADDKTMKRTIAARKQVLRDAPQDPRIEACKTVDELRLVQLSGENEGQTILEQTVSSESESMSSPLPEKA